MPQEKNSGQQARTANRSRGGDNQNRRRRSRRSSGAPPANAGGAPRGIPFPRRNRPPRMSYELRRLPPAACRLPPERRKRVPARVKFSVRQYRINRGNAKRPSHKNRPVQMARGVLLRILTAYRFRRIGRRTRGRTSAGWIYPPAPSRICRTYTPSRPRASSRHIRGRICPC